MMKHEFKIKNPMPKLNKSIALDSVILLAVIAGLIGVSITGGYTQFIIGLVAITTILCVGLNVLYGLTGLVSLGQVGFFAIGAYGSAILTLAGLNFWLSLVAATLIAGVAGCVLALSAVRMAGPFLAMVTIAFAFIVEHGAIVWRALTGGQNGLMGFPMPERQGQWLCHCRSHGRTGWCIVCTAYDVYCAVKLPAEPIDPVSICRHSGRCWHCAWPADRRIGIGFVAGISGGFCRISFADFRWSFDCGSVDCPARDCGRD